MVSIDILQKVKSSLQDFKTDVDGLFVNVSSKVESVLYECSLCIDKLESDICEREILIKKISDEMSFLEGNTRVLSNCLEGIEIKIKEFHDNMSEVDAYSSHIKNELSVLKIQYASELMTLEQKKTLEENINSLEEKFKNCELNLKIVKNEIDSLVRNKDVAIFELRKSKTKKFNLEMDLSVQKNQLEKLMLKLARLKTVFKEIKDSSTSYINVVKKVKNMSSDINQKNLNAVNRCISYINEYISVSL